jgi:hypothetical protein
MRLLLFALPLLLITSTLLLFGGAEGYSGPGFSFDLPASWSLTSSGDEAAGKIVLTAPGAQVTIDWYRDPGIRPERYLDQILRAYSSGGVAMTSAKRAKIPVQGQKAESLDLSYKYKEYGSRKRFAVWISNRSDRLFLASSSGLREDASLLDRLLQSFSDNADRLARLEPRGNSGDA